MPAYHSSSSRTSKPKKSYPAGAKSASLFLFYKKVKFAEGKPGRRVITLMVALSMEPGAEQKMRELGVKYRVRSVVE